MQAYIGIDRTALEDPTYQNGESSELAASDLFGEYALFIPAAIIAREGTNGTTRTASSSTTSTTSCRGSTTCRSRAEPASADEPTGPSRRSRPWTTDPSCPLDSLRERGGYRTDLDFEVVDGVGHPAVAAPPSVYGKC